METSQLHEWIEEDRERLSNIALDIWETPELGLHEEESAERLMEALEDEGFDIETGVGGMPTAFLAEYGEGGPRIGLLGEYDALPGLSQKVSAEPDPVEEGEPGHGCGHNLFGTACLGAAVAIKRAIDAGELEGTVVFCGCPAEETLVGKVFMARDGAFDDLDAAITWHPSDTNTVQTGSSLALNSVRYTFHGDAAHAAASPESGRSALDAVQLLGTGVEYMREHIIEEARVHYNVVEGGEAPNVVPPVSTVWFFVRAPKRKQVERITEWVDDIAAGAAQMTQTDHEKRLLTGCYDFQSNGVVSDVLWENMQATEEPDYTDEDVEFARQLQETFPEGALEDRLEDIPEDQLEEASDSPLFTDPVAPEVERGGSGSTDVGDVSWVTPTSQIRATTWPLGVPGHSWQIVASDGDFATKGMVYAAKVMAGATADLMSDEERLEAAREEFEADIGDSYESPLPDDLEPPFDVTRRD
jgi:aminobenzoyl-glutamate utilization protein B